jgi:hypothetical protein
MLHLKKYHVVSTVTHISESDYSVLFLTGLQCEAEIDECLSDPCNPEGTKQCIDLDNRFLCHCHEGYTGKLCEVRTLSLRLAGSQFTVQEVSMQIKYPCNRKHDD